MSTKKPFRKGTVSKGELVFDKNFNPLEGKRVSKTISLQSWIANTRPKVLEYTNGQGNRVLNENLEHSLNDFIF
jgi:hypothetical protein